MAHYFGRMGARGGERVWTRGDFFCCFVDGWPPKCPGVGIGQFLVLILALGLNLVVVFPHPHDREAVIFKDCSSLLGQEFHCQKSPVPPYNGFQSWKGTHEVLPE